MYEVIQYFTDLQDFNHPYKVGDVYPREGRTVSEKRLSELSGSQNRQKKPLIRLVVDSTAVEVTDEPTESAEAEQETTQYTKTDINRMSKAALVSLATAYEISGAESMSGAELKKALIEYLGL